jgi:hypothetical protein
MLAIVSNLVRRTDGMPIPRRAPEATLNFLKNDISSAMRCIFIHVHIVYGFLSSRCFDHSLKIEAVYTTNNLIKAITFSCRLCKKEPSNETCLNDERIDGNI